MRLLLDTHTLIWWLTEDSSLPDSARKLIAYKGQRRAGERCFRLGDLYQGSLGQIGGRGGPCIGLCQLPRSGAI